MSNSKDEEEEKKKKRRESKFDYELDSQVNEKEPGEHVINNVSIIDLDDNSNHQIIENDQNDHVNQSHVNQKFVTPTEKKNLIHDNVNLVKKSQELADYEKKKLDEDASMFVKIVTNGKVTDQGKFHAPIEEMLKFQDMHKDRYAKWKDTRDYYNIETTQQDMTEKILLDMFQESQYANRQISIATKENEMDHLRQEQVRINKLKNSLPHVAYEQQNVLDKKKSEIEKKYEHHKKEVVEPPSVREKKKVTLTASEYEKVRPEREKMWREFCAEQDARFKKVALGKDTTSYSGMNSNQSVNHTIDKMDARKRDDEKKKKEMFAKQHAENERKKREKQELFLLEQEKKKKELERKIQLEKWLKDKEDKNNLEVKKEDIIKEDVLVKVNIIPDDKSVNHTIDMTVQSVDQNEKIGCVEQSVNHSIDKIEPVNHSIEKVSEHRIYYDEYITFDDIFLDMDAQLWRTKRKKGTKKKYRVVKHVTEHVSKKMNVKDSLDLICHKIDSLNEHFVDLVEKEKEIVFKDEKFEVNNLSLIQKDEFVESEVFPKMMKEIEKRAGLVVKTADYHKFCNQLLNRGIEKDADLFIYNIDEILKLMSPPETIDLAKLKELKDAFSIYEIQRMLRFMLIGHGGQKDKLNLDAQVLSAMKDLYGCRLKTRVIFHIFYCGWECMRVLCAKT